jgi:hypothetical protein
VKQVPDAPHTETPVWLRSAQTFARTPFKQGTPWHPPPYDGPREKPSWPVRFGQSQKEFWEWYRNWTPHTAHPSKSTE